MCVLEGGGGGADGAEEERRGQRDKGLRSSDVLVSLVLKSPL